MIKKSSSKAKLTTSAINKIVNDLIPAEELAPSSIDEVVKLPAFLEKIRACEIQCDEKYSETDHALQNALVLRRLQQMVNTLKLNPLWKARIEEAGLKEAPSNFEEWQQIPISDKESMNKYFMGERPGMVVPLSYGGFEIIASGGTSSGQPSESVYSIRELHDTYALAGEFMGEHVLPPYLSGNDPKWVATTLADYQMWSSGTMVGGVLQNIPGINYIGAGPLSKEVYQHMMSYKGPKAIMGISQGIAYLTELGAGMDEASRNSFHVALYGSGLIPHRKQQELKELYPNLNIMSYFAATQAETIGLQLTPDSYLASVPGLHLIEIVDENGRWVEEGEEGELVVTRLHAHEAPLPRFRLGDRMIRRPNIDGPGLKTQQFEFVGRSGDVLHLYDTQYAAPQAYASLCRELKTANVLDLETLVHDFQFVNHRKDKIICLLATVDNATELNNKIESELGKKGVRRLFIDSLIYSLSLFNKSEANVGALEKTGYEFSIKLVNKDSNDIHRTDVGKVPVIRDIF